MRKKLCILISFLGTVLFAVVLYGEKLNHEKTEAALVQLVHHDIAQTEEFCRQNPEVMQPWVEYLDLSNAQSALTGTDNESQKRLLLLATTLNFAQGIENYPVLLHLHDSLNTLQSWRDQNFLMTAFRGKGLLTEIESKRSAETDARKALMRVVDTLPVEKKLELEESFLAQVNMELPDSLMKVCSQKEIKTVAKVESDSVQPASNELVVAPQETRPVHVSPLHRKAQSMQAATGTGSSTSTQSESTDSTSQSGTIPVPALRPLRVTNIPLPPVLRAPFVPKFMASGNAEQTQPMEQVEEPKDTLQLPDLPSRTKNQPQACDDINVGKDDNVRKLGEKKVIPDDSIPAIQETNVEKVEGATQSTDEEKPEQNQEQAVAESEFPALPSLHYTLVETVGNVKGSVPKYEGEKTLEEIQKELTGDFAKDLERVRQCWTMEIFRVPTEEDVAVAYEAIGIASDCVANVLNRLSEEKRASWIKLLHLNELDLNGEPNLVVLQKVHDQLSCGKVGLEMEIFVNFRDVIRHYLALVHEQQNPEKAKELFETVQLRVLKLLEIVMKDHSSINERALEDELVWLDFMGQAESTVNATRLMWNQPNVSINVDSSVFERYGSRVIEEEENIQNQVSRTSIQGKTLFNGNLTVKPVINGNRIELEVVLDGSSNSRTHAYAGPAIVSSRAKSRVLVQKSIYFDETGFNSNDADVQIRTNSQIENVQDVRNRMIIQNIATRRAYAQKSSMEQSTNAQSSQRLRNRFNTQIDSILEDWNEQISVLFQKHLRPRGLDQSETHSWSDAAGAYVQSHITCRDAMCASNLPPEMPQECDIQMAIHETMLQSAFVGYFTGMNLDVYARQHLKDTSPSFIQKAFEGQSSATDSNENWTMYFPESWPVSVSFQNGKVVCVIHVERLDYEEKSYPAVDITVNYEIEVRPDGIYLVREGDVGIFPPDFNPEQKKRLPASMVSLRRVLGKRLEKEFTPEITLKEQKLVKDPEKQNSSFANLWMKPAFMQTKDGWCLIGMNLIEKEAEK